MSEPEFTAETPLAVHPGGLRIIRAIHTGKGFLGLTQPEYRALLKERYGVSSSKDLSRRQGDDLLEHFRSMGFGRQKRKWTCTLCMPHQRKKKPIPEGTIYDASGSQLALIGELRAAIKWKAENGFSHWLLKYFGLTEIETSPEASRVITALKGLARSQKRCCDCEHKFLVEETEG